MLLSRPTVRLLVLLLSTVALAGQARADNVEGARAYVNKATAAYALNHYAVAAENFEKAFELGLHRRRGGRHHERHLLHLPGGRLICTVGAR
jgi:hypothetical protein